MQTVISGEPAHPISAPAPPAPEIEPESEYMRGWRDGWGAHEASYTTRQLTRLARLADAAERHPLIRRFLNLGDI